MASLESKRFRNASFSTANEYLVDYVLRWNRNEDKEDLHECIQPTVRNTGNRKELERIQGITQKKPNYRENDVVNEVQREYHEQKHKQAVRRRPFGPERQTLYKFQVHASFFERFKHTPLRQALEKKPKLRGDEKQRRYKKVVICKQRREDVDKVGYGVYCGEE